MDALSVAASIIGAVDLTIRSARLASQLTYNTFEILTLRALRRSFSELCADYGVIQAILLFFIFPDARDVLRRIQRHLLKPHSDLATAMEEALALKKALSDDCTMLAVAVGSPHTSTLCHRSEFSILTLITQLRQRLWRK